MYSTSSTPLVIRAQTLPSLKIRPSGFGVLMTMMASIDCTDSLGALGVFACTNDACSKQASGSVSRARRENWHENGPTAFDCAMRACPHLAVQPLRRARHAAASHGFGRGQVTPTVYFCPCAPQQKTKNDEKNVEMFSETMLQ